MTVKATAGLSLEPAQAQLLQELLEHAAGFCFSKGFKQLQIDALCGMLATVVSHDCRKWERGAEASFQHFQELMLQNSSDHIPKSRGIFSPVQAVTTVDWVLRVYYSRFRLYKHTMSRVPTPLGPGGFLKQANIAGVDEPQPMAPLDGALLFAALPSE